MAALPASNSRTDLSRRGFTNTSLLTQGGAGTNTTCRVLDLSHNELTSLPEDFCPRLAGYATLQQLDLSHNKFATVPSVLFTVSKLVHLDLSHNALASLRPDGAAEHQTWPDLAVLQNLSLSGNELLADLNPLLTPSLKSSLKILSLASCSPTFQLSALESFAQLRSLDLSSLELTSIPQPLYMLPQLQLLYLNDNKLEYVPAALFQALTSLRELQLARNHLQHLTPSLAHFYHLRHLQGNPLIQAVEGNPFASHAETVAQLQECVAQQRQEAEAKQRETADLQAKLADAQLALDAQRQQNAELVGQGQTQDTRVQQLQTRVELLGEKLLEAQRQVGEKEEALGKELLAVRSELTSSQTDVERGGRDVAELKSAQERLDAERHRLEAEKLQLVADKQRLADENQRLADEKQQAEAERQRLEAEKQQLQRDCAALNDEKIAAQEEARALRDESEQVAKQNTEAQGTQLDELQKLKDSLKQSEQKRAKLSKELEMLKDELEDTNETLKTTSMINTSLEEALVCLREHQKQSEADRAGTTMKIELLEEENKTLRDRCAELQHRLDTELSGRQSPDPNVGSNNNDQLLARIAELEEQLAGKEKEIADITKTFKEKLKRKGEKESEWLGTLADVSEALKNKEAELDATRKLLAAAQERTAELENASAQASSSAQRPRRSSFLSVPAARQFHAGSGRRDPNNPKLPPSNEIQAELNIALDEIDSLKKFIATKDEEIAKIREELNLERAAMKRSGGLGSIFSFDTTTPEQKQNLELRKSITSMTHTLSQLQTENNELKQLVAAFRADKLAAASRT